MQVPYEQISEEALRGIIIEYVTREGTDYGDIEYDLDAKVERVLGAIKKNDVLIYYNNRTQSVNLLTKYQAKDLEERRQEARENGELEDEN